jgi:hypothetical protein
VTEENLNTDKILNDILSGNKVADILRNPKEFPAALIEKLSLETALKYWNGQINYSDGDYIMNHLHGFWLSNENYFKKNAFAGIALECYEAFDAGEYYRENDDRSIDPAEKYTKPLIEAFLKKQQII